MTDVPASAASHLWLQCRQAGCGMRFPVAVTGSRPHGCPRCQSPLREVDTVAAVPGPGRDAETAAGVGSPNASGRGATTSRPGIEVAALLDNVRSARNVGAMLRTADAMGLAHLYLCGITAPGSHADIAKTALGAQDSVPWSCHPDGVALAEAVQDRGWALWAMEEGVGGQWLHDAARALGDMDAARIMLVVGHEVAGVDPGILAIADHRVAIPMRGTKRSLNVATAFGIGAHALTMHAGRDD